MTSTVSVTCEHLFSPEASDTRPGYHDVTDRTVVLWLVACWHAHTCAGVLSA